jgi:hypothetical protein
LHTKETEYTENPGKSFAKRQATLQPYSLSLVDAATYFGFAPQTLYDWISAGRVIRGRHYLKIRKKVVIIRDSFIELLHEEDGTWQSEKGTGSSS